MANKIEARQPLSRRAQIVISVILLAIVGIAVAGVLTGSGNKKIDASIDGYQVTNPSQVTVKYTTTNTSNKTGKSSCSINVSDSTNTYTGSDFGFMSPSNLQHGESYSGSAIVKVSKDGAKYITNAKISCVIE